MGDAAAALLAAVAGKLSALTPSQPEHVSDDVASNVAARAHLAAVLARRLKKLGCTHASFAALLFPSPESARRIIDFMDELLSQRASQPLTLEEEHLVARRRRLLALVRVLAQDNAALKDKLRVEARARQLAENQLANRARLLDVVAQSRARLLDWAREWELVRGPLVDEVLARGAVAAPLAAASDHNENNDDDDDAGLRDEVVTRLCDAVEQRAKLERELHRLCGEVRDMHLHVADASERLLAAESLCEQALSAADYQGGAAIGFFNDVRARFDALVDLDHQAHVADQEARELARKVQTVQARVRDLDVQRVRAQLQAVAKTVNTHD